MFTSPKIQRLVTPLRLQRRRHLRSLKIRRLEHQKEQKAEFECVVSVLPSNNVSLSTFHPAPLSQNASQRRRKRSLPSRHHIRSALFITYTLDSAERLISNLQDGLDAVLVPGSALYSTFSCGLGVTWRYILMSCFFTSHTFLTQSPMHMIYGKAARM